MRLSFPIAYMIFITWVSSIPGKANDDIVGGFIFTLLTPSLQNLLHIPAFALLMLLWLYALEQSTNLSTRIIVAFFTTVSFAGLDEWHQSFVLGRYGTTMDFVTDCIGASIMTFAYLSYQKKGQANNAFKQK